MCRHGGTSLEVYWRGSCDKLGSHLLQRMSSTLTEDGIHSNDMDLFQCFLSIECGVFPIEAEEQRPKGWGCGWRSPAT